MKSLSAYNTGSDRLLSPRLLVLDAAREPVKVLKILTEGLASDARNGIWLLNFQGVPTARAASGFDLVYLDDDYRVLQACEIEKGSEFEPFKGHPASALILQPKTVARSRTFTGDRITIESPENRSIEADAVPSSKPATASSANRAGVSSSTPPSAPQAAPPAAAAVSTSHTRSGSLTRRRSSVARRVTPPSAAQHTESTTKSSEATPASRVAPAAVASAPLPDVMRPDTGAASTTGAPRTIAPIPRELTPRLPEAPPAAPEIQFESKRTIAPTPREVTLSAPAPVIAEVPSKFEQPLVAHSFPPAKVASLEQGPAEYLSPIPAKLAAPLTAREDEQWREASSPVVDPEEGDELERLSKKILSWLYPNKKRRRGIRRAPRLTAPRLVGYYFAGGPSTPHEIRNISVTGFYMVTDQYWMPGTVIRVTLQPLVSQGEDGPDSITVLSRVVRWGPDGGGFEFVFPRLEE